MINERVLTIGRQLGPMCDELRACRSVALAGLGNELEVIASKIRILSQYPPDYSLRQKVSGGVIDVVDASGKVVG